MIRSMAPVRSRAALTINIQAIVSSAELPKTPRISSRDGNVSLLVIILTNSRMQNTVNDVRSAVMRSQMKLIIAKPRSTNVNMISQVIVISNLEDIN